MNPYIRDIDYEPIDTVEVNNLDEMQNIIQTSANKQKFEIFHQNIRSINKNIDELNLILGEMVTKVDCIILTKTFKVKDLDLFHIDGYNTIYSEGSINKNDGVIVFVKNSLKYTSKIVHVDIYNILELEIHMSKAEKVLLTATYRPHQTNAEDYESSLTAYLSYLDNYLTI